MVISNPSAEYIGFVEVLKILSKIFKKDELIIFKIDYEGVRKWTEGSWKCKEEHIKKIKQKADEIMKELTFRVSIEHVPGHSGNYGNEQADLLSKCKENINTFDFNFE